MYGRERTPNMFYSFFSQNPDFFFTYLLYTFIYYIFGSAARAVDARFLAHPSTDPARPPGFREFDG